MTQLRSGRGEPSRHEQPYGADSPIAIGRLLTQVIGLSAATLSRRQVAITARLPADLPPIWGSQIQLRQLFLSLLALSSEVAHPGATICISAQQLAAPSLSFHDRPTVLITLSFLPADPTTIARPQPPTGALNRDLALCAQIAAEHGGRLTHHAYRRYTLAMPAYKGNSV